ncbi:hypothetical protein [Leptothermofonsia sp. ETS-13]|uniref:hypothetical protein n=1 Tax=Leptothermofonsia sp. ETS-13 TaxID=3035696 RepID=UPI003BA04B43
MELYLGVHSQKLRFFTAEGELVPTPEEFALAEQRKVQEAEAQLEQAEALLARYREHFGELPANENGQV